MNDVIERIRRVFGTPIPAFLISGDTAPERLREAKPSGFYLLHKPVLAITLRSVVSQLQRNCVRWGTDPPQRPSRATGGLSGTGPLFRLQHRYNLRPLGLGAQA
jgi:hypothetical protein